MVGPDCTGLGSECLALKYLGVPWNHMFSPECNRRAKVTFRPLHAGPASLQTHVQGRPGGVRRAREAQGGAGAGSL